jgi:hypothetical protein
MEIEAGFAPTAVSNENILVPTISATSALVRKKPDRNTKSVFFF